MADHKFTLEEILREYDSDGKRSGIRREEDRPLSHGTLETEKLVTAATSSRPISQERAGYHAVEPVSAPTPEEDLVDIKSTISHIKANKAAQAALDAGASPGTISYPEDQSGRCFLFTVCGQPDAAQPLSGK